MIFKTRPPVEKEPPAQDEGKSTTLSDYLAGRLEWEERYGSLLTRLSNAHRLIAFLAPTVLVLSIGLILSRQRERIIPYVAVLNQRGQALGITSGLKPIRPDQVEAIIAEDLQAWVRNVRTVTTDYNAQRAMMESAIQHTSDAPGKARNYLENWFEQHKPDERAKRETVTVEITSLLKQSDDSYEVEWTETPTPISGETGTPERWKALLRVGIRANAVTQEQLFSNPTGFYITEIHWSRKL